MKKISLSETPDMPPMMAMSEPSEHNKAYFPSVTLRETGGLKLPDSGQITLEFVKIRSEEEIYDGKKTYRCTISLKSIIDVEDTDVKEPASNKSKDAGDALDAIRAEKMKDDESEEY